MFETVASSGVKNMEEQILLAVSYDLSMESPELLQLIQSEYSSTFPYPILYFWQHHCKLNLFEMDRNKSKSIFLRFARFSGP